MLLIGYPGTTIYSADRYALELFRKRSAISARASSRASARSSASPTTSARRIFSGWVPGYFAFYAGTEPEKVQQVETEMLKEAAALRTDGLTAEELKRAKAKVVGQKKIARQDLGSYAMATALDELYGLGFDHSDTEDAKYEAVTLAQTQEIARKYLRPDSLVVAIVQPEYSAMLLPNRHFVVTLP